MTAILTGTGGENTDSYSDEISNYEELYRGASVPTYRKYTIGISEAAGYYGIGEKKLRQIIADNPLGDFYLEIGKKLLIKRRQFEEYLDGASSL